MLKSFQNQLPQMPVSVYVAETAQVIGRVIIGHDSSIWFGTVIRGDVNTISIGERTNIQDNAVVHVDRAHPVLIGDDVTVGHGAIVHGCTVGNGSLIGMGAIVLDGAVIGKSCLIGAGTLIPPGKLIPDYSMVVGSPGKIIRSLTEAEVEGLRTSAERYVQYSKSYQDHEDTL